MLYPRSFSCEYFFQILHESQQFVNFFATMIPFSQLATDVTPPPTPRKTTTPTVGFQEDHKYKKPPRDHRELFFHFTTATDTNNIKLVNYVSIYLILQANYAICLILNRCLWMFIVWYLIRTWGKLGSREGTSYFLNDNNKFSSLDLIY